MRNIVSNLWRAASLLLFSGSVVIAWDYEGHRTINQLAIQSLPTNYPSFVFAPEARERIAFLAGEPDRWRNSPDQTLRHFNNPDHYFDLDELGLFDLAPKTAKSFRYDFTAQLTLGRAAHPDRFPRIDPLKDLDHTKALIGFLPWTITEYQGKLKSAFSYLREFEQAGEPDEIANARRNIIDLMGLMGHFVGDGAQPLHTTKHYNGWVGDNPNRFTTNRSFHSWIDGGYLQKVGMDKDALRRGLRPAGLLEMDGTTVSPTNIFGAVMAYLEKSHRQVEPLYRLDKEGKLSGQGEVSKETRHFLDQQILAAAQMLGDLWLTAWQQAPPDTFLRSALARRNLGKESLAPAQPKQSGQKPATVN